MYRVYVFHSYTHKWRHKATLFVGGNFSRHSLFGIHNCDNIIILFQCFSNYNNNYEHEEEKIQFEKEVREWKTD